MLIKLMNQVQAKYKLVGSPLRKGRRTVAAYFVCRPDVQAGELTGPALTSGLESIFRQSPSKRTKSW